MTLASVCPYPGFSGDRTDAAVPSGSVPQRLFLIPAISIVQVLSLRGRQATAPNVSLRGAK